MHFILRSLIPLVCFLALTGTVTSGAEPTVVQAIESVRQLAFARQTVKVQVRGVVIEAPGRLPADPRFFHIQDKSAGIAVLPPDRMSLNLGDCVDVVGTTMLFNDLEPQIGAPTVRLADAPCGEPEVRPLSADEVRAGRDSGVLIRVLGRVLDSSVGDDRALILVGSAKPPLRIILRRPGGALADIRRKAEAGALIEVVGVSLPSPDGKSHYLRLRRSEDIVQKAPPPFRPHPAVLWLSVVLAGLAVATFSWIFTLRRAVGRKTREISQLLEQAEAASVTKSQFLANMSHEIRTPIHGIMGMQEMVLQSNLQPVQRESLEIAHSATRSLLSLLNDILDLSKIEANGMKISPEPLNLLGLMAELERQFQAVARLSGVAFKVNVDRDLPQYVMGDALRLRQVLTNLLSNAFKFTAEGSVAMNCSVARGPTAGERKPAGQGNAARVRFAVQDTGIGIAQSQLEKVFSAFHQADGTITRRFGGTGLGLTIASHLVNLMGGSLNCESTEGRGSIFSFEVELPLAEKLPAEERPAEDGLPVKALNVLLAEDNLINQLVVRRPLEALGHKFVVCEDGQQAVELCSERSFDIVLMDVQMPVMDGLEAARRIRQAELRSRTPRVPILALTANSLREQIDACYEAGMDACLCKPFLPADLLSLISVHAQRQKPPSPVRPED